MEDKNNTRKRHESEFGMQQTSLYETHVNLGGRMVEFAGWELPVQYPAGPTAEHHSVRNAAGLFDIDHMGQIELSGPDVEAFLQNVQVWDVSKLAEMDAHYSLLLYDDGTFVDDIFIYRLTDRWLVVVNAANHEKDLSWLKFQAVDFDVDIDDVSDETYMLALQGPRAEDILQRLTNKDLSVMPARTGIQAQVAGVDMLVGRTGYTGEDGFELYFADDKAVQVWNDLLNAGEPDGILPCGLAARDSLRFEACMALYGHEIDATTTPLEARLGWVVSWHKQFVGRQALLKQKLETPERLLVGFEMVERAVPREHYPIAVDGQVAGYVTTGMKSPTLDKFLGMGYVPRHLASIGSEFDVLIREQPRRARVVKRPFYKPNYK